MCSMDGTRMVMVEATLHFVCFGESEAVEYIFFDVQVWYKCYVTCLGCVLMNLHVDTITSNT
jgi:hypothetical protein